jgi:SulP family sulfate permease
MLLIVVVFSGLVGEIAIPTLAAVLIYAAVSSLRTGRIDTIARTGTASRIAFVTTLLATLVLPVAAAVGIGVALSLLLQLGQEAEDLTVMRAELSDDDRFVEQPAPAKLASNEVTLLHVYGSLQFAGARTLQVLLPDPAGVTRPVVILRLRGRSRLGATSFIVLADYAERIRVAGGHLFLSGVDSALTEQLIRTRRVDLEDAVTVLEASATVGDSTREAYAQARAWLAAAADAEPGER